MLCTTQQLKSKNVWRAVCHHFAIRKNRSAMERCGNLVAPPTTNPYRLGFSLIWLDVFDIKKNPEILLCVHTDTLTNTTHSINHFNFMKKLNRTNRIRNEWMAAPLLRRSIHFPYAIHVTRAYTKR